MRVNRNKKYITGISDINLGVEIYENGIFQETVSSSDGSFILCPVCNSSDIESGRLDGLDVIIWRTKMCNNCGTTFKERFDICKVSIDNQN